MMLAGLPVPDHAVEELAAIVRAAGADDLADRLHQANAADVKLFARIPRNPSCLPARPGLSSYP